MEKTLHIPEPPPPLVVPPNLLLWLGVRGVRSSEKVTFIWLILSSDITCEVKKFRVRGLKRAQTFFWENRDSISEGEKRL